MDLLLKRTHQINKSTLGELFIDGRFFCYTLEDLTRSVKIKHETAIPAGKYLVIINHSPRFKTDLPLLINVPNYVGVRIHNGVSPDHTSGCILVGSAINNDQLLHSKTTLGRLLSKMKSVINKETIHITIQDIPVKELIPNESETLIVNTPEEFVQIVPTESIPVVQQDTFQPTSVPTESFITKVIKLIQWLRTLLPR